MRATPRSPYAVWAASGTLLALLLLSDVAISQEGILRPIRAGSRGPGADLIARDFPDITAPYEMGLDGEDFYAIARDPLHPDVVAPSLDRPQYRYRRPLYPAMAWLLHPSGGGPGLVRALVAVSILALVVGGLAIGALSDILRGPPWLAMLFPILPGSLWALTSSLADGLAVALSLVTIVAMLRGKDRLAWVAAVAAVLTKETAILVPLALVLARRRRSDLPLLALPVLALGWWLLMVGTFVPSGGPPPEHLVLPFTGLFDALAGRWLRGQELIGMASTISALVVGLLVLARASGPPELRWVIGVQLAFLTVCSGAVLGDDFGGPRATLLLLAVSLAVLVSCPSESARPETDELPVAYRESALVRTVPV